jgi:antitoxin VapB
MIRQSVSKVGDKVILKPSPDQFWAELDALGARDFLPNGIPDEPPTEPDQRFFFDE